MPGVLPQPQWRRSPPADTELRAAGVEILGDPQMSGSEGWLHFRAPDANVYGLTAASYARPVEG